jgi:polyisoprenoid-binding protein YceI
MATEAVSANNGVLPLGTWSVDPVNSQVDFVVPFLWGLTKVKGSFTLHHGSLISQPGSVTGELVIDASSVHTKNPKRDTHLRSPDFFDVERHPEIVFTTAGIARSDNGLTISGDLRIGETTQRLRLAVEADDDGDRLLLRSTTPVNRELAGLHWNQLGLIRGDAQLHVELQLRREH